LPPYQRLIKWQKWSIRTAWSGLVAKKTDFLCRHRISRSLFLTFFDFFDPPLEFRKTEFFCQLLGFLRFSGIPENIFVKKLVK
jgi:hypothetical protein